MCDIDVNVGIASYFFTCLRFHPILNILWYANKQITGEILGIVMFQV